MLDVVFYLMALCYPNCKVLIKCFVQAWKYDRVGGQAFIQTLVNIRFKVQFLYFLLSSPSLNFGLQFAGKCISDTFFDCRSLTFHQLSRAAAIFLGIKRFIGNFEESLTRSFKLKRLSFITQFKIHLFFLSDISIYLS